MAPPPPCAKPLFAVSEDASFYISPAFGEGRGYGLTVGRDAENESKVKLGVITGSDKEKWRLVDGDTLMNVYNGEYLDSDTQYAYLDDLSQVWRPNPNPNPNLDPNPNPILMI